MQTRTKVKKLYPGSYEYKGYAIQKYDDPSGYAHVRTPPFWFVKDASGIMVYKTSTKADCIWYINQY